jgi:hypothetical protein
MVFINSKSINTLVNVFEDLEFFKCIMRFPKGGVLTKTNHKILCY